MIPTSFGAHASSVELFDLSPNNSTFAGGLGVATSSMTGILRLAWSVSSETLLRL
jgi:hypothetical protein